MYLLSVATKTIPVSTAYAVWVGVGAVGAFLVSSVLKGDETNIGQMIAIAALVVAIVAVKLTAAREMPR